MGLFLCELCNEQLGDNHICKPEDVKEYVNYLKEQHNISLCKLNEINNAVLMLTEQLPSLESKEITINTSWLRRLWAMTHCQWQETKDPDKFLLKWLALHSILVNAFNVFRSKKTLLQKLVSLRNACDHAKVIMNYQDSNLNLSPEEVIKS